MVKSSDFNQTCNFDLISDFCTPSTCCLAQGEIEYLPTLAGNAFYLSCFAVLLLAQLALLVKYRTWTFGIWMSIGLAGEIVGYCGRVMLYQNIFSFNAFLVYLVPLTISPALITASIYLCLARIVLILDPFLTATRLKPTTYTKIFVTFDFIALVLQGAGGGIAATGNTKVTKDMGVNIMIAGLSWQVVSLVAFIALCCDFAQRLKKQKYSSNRRSNTASNGTDQVLVDVRATVLFRAFLVSLAVATVLILVRSIYRVAELQGGFGGRLANDQVLFMILEGPMVILAAVGLTVFHPGPALKGLWNWKRMAQINHGIQLARDSAQMSEEVLVDENALKSGAVQSVNPA